MRKLDRLLKRAEKHTRAPEEKVRLIFADGHVEETRNTLAVKVRTVEAMMDCDCALEGGTFDSYSGIIRVEHEDGTVEDFVEAWRYYNTDEGKQHLERVIDELTAKYADA